MRHRAAAALRQRRRRRRSPEVPRRVSSFPRFGFSYKPFRFFSSLPIRFLSDFSLNRSGVLDRFFVSISFPKTLDWFSFFFRTVRLNERDHRLFPVNDARSFNRSSLSFRRIYSAIAISDPIFVLVYLLARLSESGDSSAWSFISKPPFRLINLNKLLLQ